MAFWVVSLSRVSSSLLLSSLSPISLSLSRLSLCRQPTTGSPCNNKFTISSFSFSTQHSTPSLIDSCSVKQSNRWRPMCLYYTQGKCTKLDDASHIEKFNHNCSWDLDLSLEVVKKARPQKLDYFLVLDLEGKVEILEFPVLMIDAKTMAVVDIFHRFVRPSVMSEQRINEYIEGKYGKLGVDRVWHDTAIPFDEVINQFEDWMCGHNLWGEGSSGCLTNAAFVTCGNWDLNTKVPQQCKVLKMNLPSYFMAWINLKDVYLNFYKRRATGMVTMMRELGIPLMGSHHLGIDDTKNITRVVQRMLMDGALLQITAKRSLDNFENIEFLFRNRIR